MRATRHNGRSGKHGVYNPKHNDRKFDIANMRRGKSRISIGTVTGDMSRTLQMRHLGIGDRSSRRQVFMILKRCIMKTITAIL